MWQPGMAGMRTVIEKTVNSRPAEKESAGGSSMEVWLWQYRLNPPEKLR